MSIFGGFILVFPTPLAELRGIGSGNVSMFDLLLITGLGGLVVLILAITLKKWMTK